MRTRCRVVTLLAALGLGACAVPEAPEIGPAELAALGASGRAAGYNVLLITLDTVRADHLGCYGRDGGATPAIDGLARTGVLFRNAVTSVPLTLPAHSTMMTGLFAPAHGVRHNGTYVLSDTHETLAEVLQERGYRTAAFIGAFVLDARFGLAQGFETYDDAVHAAPDRASDAFNERPANAVADAALGWLAARASDPSPFFLWVHFFDPHAPYAPPAELAQRFSASPYDGEIAFVDSQIARILSYLSERGLAERTLVVLTADHGEGLGEHGEPTHGMLLYESTVHVPLVFSAPALFPNPVAYGAGAVSLADLLPTTLGLVGLPLGGAVDGRDLFAAPPDERRVVHLETLGPYLDQGWSPLAAVRRARAKLVQAPTMEFYRLDEDPGEQDNRYAPPAPEVEELEQALRELSAQWDSPEQSLVRRVPLDADDRARLEALGYVDGSAAPPQITLADPKEMMPFWRRIESADALCEAGRLPEAVQAIEAVLAEQPDNATAWYTATRIFNRSKQTGRALEAVRRAVELHPRSEGYVTLAQLSWVAGDVEGFERALSAAEKLDARDGGISIARGDSLAVSGRFEEALGHFERALEVDPYRSGVLARAKIAAVKQRLGRS